MIIWHYAPAGIRRCTHEHGLDTHIADHVTCPTCVRMLAADMGRMAQMATQLQRYAIQRAAQLEVES